VAGDESMVGLRARRDVTRPVPADNNKGRKEFHFMRPRCEVDAEDDDDCAKSFEKMGIG